jgi:hypothetical protein
MMNWPHRNPVCARPQLRSTPEAITVQDFFIFESVTAVIVFLFWRHKKK